MTNLEKYNNAFIDVFSISENTFSEQDIDILIHWDSVHQLSLISAVEEAFDIMLDTEDILGFSSHTRGKEILSSKYDIGF